MNRSAPDAPPWPLEDGERVLWEGAPDPAAPPSDGIGPVFRTRFLAGFLLLLLAIVIEGKWYLPAERRREWSRRFFLVTDRRAVSPYDTVADDFDRLFPPVVKRIGRDRANVYFAARPGSPPPRRPNAFNAVGFLDLPDADVPAALAALEELRNSAEPR